MSRSLLSLPILLAFVASGYLEGVPGQQARHDLDDCYRKHEQGNFEGAIEALHSTSPFVRQYAAAYVLALYRGAWEDETSGRISWHSTPYWGGPSESDAREMRASLATSLGRDAQGEEAVAVVAWALRHERVTSIRTSLAEALPRLTGPAADALTVRLLGGNEGNRTVLSLALAQVRARRLMRAGPDVLRLVDDPRPSIAKAARDAAAAFSWPVAPESPERAFPAWLHRALTAVSKRVLDPVPATARWAIFRIHADRADIPDSVGLTTRGGWWLGQTDSTIRCLDWFGRADELPRARTEVEFATIEKTAAILVEARSHMNERRASGERAWGVLSRDGGMTGQFEPRDFSLPEALVAAWAEERGERSAARAILAPRLEALEDGNDLDAMARDLQGTVYHLAMLDRFSLDRDYAETIRVGKHLSQPEFAGYAYQSRAHELAQQLQSRATDFGSFRLPDSASWARARAGMSRPQQIAYLAERLRLLNCFQMMQPGGVRLDEPQYALATRKTDVWSAPRQQSRTTINPWVELRDMKLGIDDLPGLAPFVVDRNFTLTFEFWRDFHPDRTLYRVNMLVANLIEDIAGRDLVRLDEFGRLSADQQRARVEEVTRWARDHHGWSRQRLMLDCLQVSDRWQDMATVLYEAKRDSMAVPAFGPILLSRMDDFRDMRGYLLEDAFGFDSSSAIARSRGLLGDEDLEVRLRAARMLIRHGGAEADLGIAAIRRLEKDAPNRFWSAEAFDDLVANGRPTAIDLAATALRSDWYGSGGEGYLRMAQRLFLLGREESLAYLVSLLHNPGTVTWARDARGAQIAVSAQDRAANELAAWRKGMDPLPATAAEGERAGRRAELETWLRDEFAKVLDHKPGDVVPLSASRH